MKTAALLVIGDEILTGKIKDENSVVFAKLMFEQGVRVQKIETIPDQIHIIASSVRYLSQNHSYVCTSGGVGPTHDDRTFEGIAHGLDKPLIEHQEALTYFKNAQSIAGRGHEINNAQRKMLIFPSPCQLYFLKPLWLPLVQVDNVYIFPGVPGLFSKLITNFAWLFTGSKFYRELIYTDQSESLIAQGLSQVAESMPELSIGSYPQMPTKSYHVMISVEGESQEQVNQATKLLLAIVNGRREPKLSGDDYDRDFGKPDQS